MSAISLDPLPLFQSSSLLRTCDANLAVELKSFISVLETFNFQLHCASPQHEDEYFISTSMRGTKPLFSFAERKSSFCLIT